MKKFKATYGGVILTPAKFEIGSTGCCPAPTGKSCVIPV
jgi:hypothetical protein